MDHEDLTEQEIAKIHAAVEALLPEEAEALEKEAGKGGPVTDKLMAELNSSDGAWIDRRVSPSTGPSTDEEGGNACKR